MSQEKRILIREIPRLVGRKVRLSGWVSVRRDHGKIIFIDLRDRTGTVQAVLIPDKEKAYNLAKDVKSEFVVSIFGLIKERPGGQVREENPMGGFEIEVEEMEILSAVKEELPFEVSKKDLDLPLATLLDNRNLSLRNKGINDIFKVYDRILSAYEQIMREEDFFEIKTPKILSSATEGGANFFKIKYFDREAFLAQSPQFYKQAGVGFFERVFEIGTVFRAEPHFTTRHVNEYVSLDAEMGFIENFSEVMDCLEKVMKKMMKAVLSDCAGHLKEKEPLPLFEKDFPRVKLEEALEILKKEYGKETLGIDIDPEGERLICEWAQKNHESDFVFLTHYPASARPFYTMPGSDPRLTESFDLLYRGVEIASGGQRIHDYDQLVSSISKHRLDPKDFKSYLEIFKLGMPPHGGWGLGSERILQKTMNLKSIKEAILFPRDVKRLDP